MSMFDLSMVSGWGNPADWLKLGGQGAAMMPQIDVGAPLGLPGVPAPAAVAGITPSAALADPNWFQRNISNPLGKAFERDPNAKPGELSPGMKSLAAFGAQMSGGGGGGGGGGGPQPAPGGAGGYRPQPIDAGAIAMAQQQAAELLRKRATLNAPWLTRMNQQQLPGLMG